MGCIFTKPDCKLLGNLDHIPKFPFKGIYKIRIISVYDGDTVNIAFTHKGAIFKYSLRILGVDTPEIRGNYPDAYKKYARDAKQYVESILPTDKLIYANFVKYDKYGGRLLGDILLDDDTLSQKLIQNNYAFKYNGEKKKTQNEWMEFITSHPLTNIPL